MAAKKAYGNYHESQNSFKREAEKHHAKTYRILAEHISPSESPSKSEPILNPKFDYIEFDEKNVDTLEEVDDIPQGDDKSKRYVGNAQDSNFYGTLENLKEQPKRNAQSKEYYVEDPAFRNRRSRLSGIFLRDLNSDLYRSIREKDLQKRLSYENEDLLDNSNSYKTARDMTNTMAVTEKENLRNPQRQNHRGSYIKKSIKQSPLRTRDVEGFTSASINLNHNQSLDNPVTLQPEKKMSSNLNNDTKRTLFGSNPGSIYDVNYVEDKTKRDVKCDNIFLQLFRSSALVVSIIFVLIVIVIILILFIIFKTDMRSVKKQKYKKPSTENFVRDRHRSRKNSETSNSETSEKSKTSNLDTSEKSKTSNSIWKLSNAYLKGLMGMATLTTSSDETTASESEKGKIKDFRKVNRGTQGRENNSKKPAKYQTSEEKMKTNKYSAIRYQPKSNGSILSYTRLTKKKAKGDCSSIECACVELDSSSMVKPSRSSHRSTSAISKAKDTLNWVQRKVTFTTSDAQTSSDDEDNIKTSKHKSNSDVSEGVGTKIKDMILSPLKQVYNKATGESDSDSRSKVVREKKKKALKKKSQNIGLEHVLREAEFSSSQSHLAKPTDLVKKIVTTGDSRKIDTMLTGEAWNRAFYYSQGIRTLDSGNESFDNHPGVKDSMDENSQDKTSGALKESSSFRALQDEIGKSMDVAEDNIKKVDGNPPENDLKDK